MQILDRHRLIQPQVVLEPDDVGFRNMRILQIRREWAARRLAQDAVKNDRDEQQQRNVLQRAADDIRKQRGTSGNEPTLFPGSTGTLLAP